MKLGKTIETLKWKGTTVFRVWVELGDEPNMGKLEFTYDFANGELLSIDEIDGKCEEMQEFGDIWPYSLHAICNGESVLVLDHTASLMEADEPESCDGFLRAWNEWAPEHDKAADTLSDDEFSIWKEQNPEPPYNYEAAVTDDALEDVVRAVMEVARQK